MNGIDNDLVNNNNYYKYREGGDNVEEDLPTVELIKANKDANLSQTEITVEDIEKMCTKHLKEYLIARTFITAGNKQVLLNHLTKCITNNAPITDRSKIVILLSFVR